MATYNVPGTYATPEEAIADLHNMSVGDEIHVTGTFSNGVGKAAAPPQGYVAGIPATEAQRDARRVIMRPATGATWNQTGNFQLVDVIGLEICKGGHWESVAEDATATLNIENIWMTNCTDVSIHGVDQWKYRLRMGYKNTRIEIYDNTCGFSNDSSLSDTFVRVRSYQHGDGTGTDLTLLDDPENWSKDLYFWGNTINRYANDVFKFVGTIGTVVAHNLAQNIFDSTSTTNPPLNHAEFVDYSGPNHMGLVMANKVFMAAGGITAKYDSNDSTHRFIDNNFAVDVDGHTLFSIANTYSVKPGIPDEIHCYKNTLYALGHQAITTYGETPVVSTYGGAAFNFSNTGKIYLAHNTCDEGDAVCVLWGFNVGGAGVDGYNVTFMELRAWANVFDDAISISGTGASDQVVLWDRNHAESADFSGATNSTTGDPNFVLPTGTPSSRDYNPKLNYPDEVVDYFGGNTGFLWRNNESSGNPQDYSGNGLHVSGVVGSPTYSETAYFTDTTGISYTEDFGDRSVLWDTHYSYNISLSWSVGCWFRVNSFTGDSTDNTGALNLLDKESWTVSGMRLGISSASGLGIMRYLTLFDSGTPDGIFYDTGQDLLGQWVHIVGTYNGTTARLFFNGTPVASYNISITDNTIDWNSGVGWGGTAGDAVIDCTIHDLFFVEHVMEDAEIANLAAQKTSKIIDNVPELIPSGMLTWPINKDIGTTPNLSDDGIFWDSRNRGSSENIPTQVATYTSSISLTGSSTIAGFGEGSLGNIIYSSSSSGGKRSHKTIDVFWPSADIGDFALLSVTVPGGSSISSAPTGFSQIASYGEGSTDDANIYIYYRFVDGTEDSVLSFDKSEGDYPHSWSLDIFKNVNTLTPVSSIQTNGSGVGDSASAVANSIKNGPNAAIFVAVGVNSSVENITVTPPTLDAVSMIELVDQSNGVGTNRTTIATYFRPVRNMGITGDMTATLSTASQWATVSISLNSIEPSGATISSSGCFLDCSGSLNIHSVVEPSSSPFKMQHGSFTIANGSTTGTTTITTVSSLNNAFVILNNVHRQGTAGDDAGGTPDGNDHQGVAIYLSDTSTISAVRGGSENTVTIYYTVIEYIGGAGGSNEFIVRDQGLKTMPGASTSVELDPSLTGDAIGTVADGTIIINGVAQNLAAQEGRKLSTMGIRSTTTSGHFTLSRIESGAPDASIGYAIVEFSGSNWTVNEEKITRTAVQNETHTITSVTDWTKAFFLFSYEGSTAASEANDDQQLMVWPGTATQLKSFSNDLQIFSFAVFTVYNAGLSVEHDDTVDGALSAWQDESPGTQLDTTLTTSVDSLETSFAWVTLSHSTSTYAPSSGYWSWGLSAVNTLSLYREFGNIQTNNWSYEVIDTSGLSSPTVAGRASISATGSDLDAIGSTQIASSFVRLSTSIMSVTGIFEPATSPVAMSGSASLLITPAVPNQGEVVLTGSAETNVVPGEVIGFGQVQLAGSGTVAASSSAIISTSISIDSTGSMNPNGAIETSAAISISSISNLSAAFESFGALFSINSIRFTDQGRTINESREERSVQNQRYNSLNTKYIKAVKKKWTVEWKWLPSHASATFDGLNARDDLYTVVTSKQLHTIQIVNSNLLSDTFDVYVDSYKEEIIRRDIISGEVFYNVSVTFIQK